MKFTLAATVAFLAACSASAAVVDRASTKCYTVHSGYLSTLPGDKPTKWVPVGVNSKKQVTYGTSDPWLKVEFQSCPKLPQQAPNIDMYKGRMIVSGTTTSTNGTTTTPNCVTVTNPSSAKGPYFLQLKKCVSDTVPPPAQKWEYGNDFGAVVFWTGSNSNGLDEVGYTDDKNYDPVTEKSTHRIELGCAKTCSSFGIKTKSQLNDV